MNVLIIEDEVNAFNYLKLILQQVRPDYTILKHLESVEDAINWLFQNDQPNSLLSYPISIISYDTESLIYYNI